MKEKASDKRLRTYTKAVQLQILHPDYESRITIAQIFDDKKPQELITGRACIGSEKKLNKKTGKTEDRIKYKVTRKFVVFEDDSRLSVSGEIFSHLKSDHKLPHDYENYYA